MQGAGKGTVIPVEVEQELAKSRGKFQTDQRKFYGEYNRTSYKAKGSTMHPWILMVEKYDSDVVARL